MHRLTHLTIEQRRTRGEIDCGRSAGSHGSLPPGVAGGIARARHAWRYDDGTFMSYKDEERIHIEQRERMARGGRARAKHAKRKTDGTFLPDEIP